MFTLPASVRVVLATETVDMRKSIDGLMALVKPASGEDVYPGHLFSISATIAGPQSEAARSGSEAVTLPYSIVWYNIMQDDGLLRTL